MTQQCFHSSWSRCSADVQRLCFSLQVSSFLFLQSQCCLRAAPAPRGPPATTIRRLQTRTGKTSQGVRHPHLKMSPLEIIVWNQPSGVVITPAQTASTALSLSTTVGILQSRPGWEGAVRTKSWHSSLLSFSADCQLVFYASLKCLNLHRKSIFLQREV